MLVREGVYLDGSKFFEGGGGELVFAVKVGGDDEESVMIEFFEGLIENFGPDGSVVPVILMAEEGDIDVFDLL